MKSFIFCIVFVSAGWALAQVQVQGLSEESLNNNKTIVVDNLTHKGGIKVKVVGVHKGEPAMLPVYIYPWIQCSKQATAKPIDLATIIGKSGPASFSRYIGGPSKSFPSGVVHVCALENVNFDESKIFISVFLEGPNGCDRTRVTDFIVPRSSFCSQ